MPLNLKGINPGKGSQLTAPRDIFAALPDRPWPRLRPEQVEVLEQWHKRRNERDLVIKQNTGGGKTLVGLLIGQSSLNEAMGPVVYLVPDTYLIQQVVGAANEVGIAVTDNARDEDFLAGKAILVATFDKLINGRSTFGVTGYKKVTQLGTVIVDDAHAALSSADNQFRAVVPESCPAYSELLALFAADLQRQNPKAFADLKDGQSGSPLRVPPKAALDRAQAALDILNPYGDDSNLKSLYFAWPLVAEHLDSAVITFTDREVEIKTPCPAISMIPAFAQAKRRVYLTATLANEGVLVTELGANADAVRQTIVPARASDLGDRVIIAPLSINPDLDPEQIRELARNFADGDRNGDGHADADPINVVILVPSNRAAQNWQPYADEIVNVKTMGPVVDRLTDGEHVGIIVLINKYDGVDLPNDACRLLIVDGIPTPLRPHEQRESAALTGSDTYLARTVQRIEQGMGRGIRDVEDYCAVLLMTREASLTLRNVQSRQYYSPATRRQVELSQEVAAQIAGEGIDPIRQLLDLFLNRDDEWKIASRAAIAEAAYPALGQVSALDCARREAWDRAIANDFTGSVTVLRAAISDLTDDLERGWRMEELASYQTHFDSIGAQKTLRSARISNPAVLKPDAALPAIPAVKGPAHQGTEAARYLAEKYSDPVELRLSIGCLFDNIVWGVRGTADQAEQQIQHLGEHLGFGSQRPEKESDDGGPDNLWGLGPTSNAVIELKTEVSRDDKRIIKSEAEQLLHSMEWDRLREPGKTRVPVLIHPSTVLHPKATLAPDTRIITPDDLKKLQDNVVAFANDLVADKWSDPATVAAALLKHNLTADRIIPVHSSKLAPRT